MARMPAFISSCECSGFSLQHGMCAPVPPGSSTLVHSFPWGSTERCSCLMLCFLFTSYTLHLVLAVHHLFPADSHCALCYTSDPTGCRRHPGLGVIYLQNVIALSWPEAPWKRKIKALRFVAVKMSLPLGKWREAWFHLDKGCTVARCNE